MQPDHLQRTNDGSSLKLRIRRQTFVPSNIGTNTFILDTTSFLSLLTLVVFLVRVFSRVIRSNTAQRVTVGADPSLARTFRNLGPETSDVRREFMKVNKHNLESAMKNDKSKTRLKRNRRSNDRRSIDQVNDKSINLLFRGDIATPVINMATTDNFESVSLPVLDQTEFESQFHKRISATTWTQSVLTWARKLRLVSKESAFESLDRRKRGDKIVNENGRQFIQRPLPPIVQQQGGIAGVDYDTIYLSIGVAATALFIIETLYKAYQLYIANNGRSLGSDTLVDRLLGSDTFVDRLSDSWSEESSSLGWHEPSNEHG
eukprot:TRINITY_DN10635_c0_g1_i1.p1 TRINITY_DN10635_c0_g1~~TRINITY_DN10635_c0_g1_i1.p1  ORF type:complete len:317 (-),score=42.67 TRINITY_DN10635_c0_g1_i1:70-1020(-)